MAERPSLSAPPRSRPLPLSALATRQVAPSERPRRVLFGESFDPPPPLQHAAAEPEIIAPSFTLEDLELARADAFAEGRKAGMAEAEAGLTARQAAALESCERAIAASLAEARRAAEATIAALGRALIGSLATVLADQAAALLPARVERLVADLTTSLGSGVTLDLYAAPQIVAVLEPALTTTRVRAGASTALRLHADPSLSPSEVRVRWASAEALIDPAAAAEAIRRLLDELLIPSPSDVTFSGEHP
ncbi:MAG: hypothetical protein NZ523_03575 [Elioraea sp.]|nr:hypothetical protein [Elioraea sp.]